MILVSRNVRYIRDIREGSLGRASNDCGLCNVEILAQSSADFALTQAYNFWCTHILGASRGHLSDSMIYLLK